MYPVRKVIVRSSVEEIEWRRAAWPELGQTTEFKLSELSKVAERCCGYSLSPRGLGKDAVPM